MKKHFLGLILVLIGQQLFAQFDYKQNNDADVPVVGWQMGVVGGGFSAMQPNRDDIDADQRLDPQMTNFSYGGGIERIIWFQPTFGFGGQLLYWQGGASYLGDDTISKIQLKAKTSMTYLKLPFLFHFKSFNRYYPNRKIRFTASVGPYVALMTNYSDKVTYTKTSDKNYRQEVSFKGTRFVDANGNGGELSAAIYNPFDLGMVFAVGGEIRITRKTVLAVQIRTDVGFSNIENLRKLRIKFDNTSTEQDFNLWNGYYAKYITPNALDVAAGFEANRPASKNFSLGGFISYRKYLTK